MQTSDLADGLLVQPWSSITLGDTSFIAKACFRDACYGLLISDMDLVWYEEADSYILKQRSQELNKRLKAAVPAFFRHLRELICPLLEGGRKGSAASFTCERKQHQLIIHVRSELFGVPFYWDFYCSEATVSMVSLHLVCPLLKMTHALQKQTQELIALLERKNAEIQDYKENGAVLSRGRLETDVFNQYSFMEDFLAKMLPDSCVGKEGTVFTSELQELYTAVVKKDVDHKRKRHGSGDERKDEFESQSSPADDKTEDPFTLGMEVKQEGDISSQMTVEPFDSSLGTAVAATPSVSTVRSSVPAARTDLKQKKKKAKGIFG